MNEQLMKSTTELLASMADVIKQQETRISDLEGKVQTSAKEEQKQKEAEADEKTIDAIMKNLM